MTDEPKKEPKAKTGFSEIGRAKRSKEVLPSTEPSPEQDAEIESVSRSRGFRDRAESNIDDETENIDSGDNSKKRASAIKNGRGRRTPKKNKRDVAIISIRCDLELERRWKIFNEIEGYRAYHDALLDLLDHAKVPEYD